MDYDDDGILDFISGSYDPGDTYLFRGLGGGKYAAVEKIRDRAGVPIVHHPQQLAAYEQMRNDPGADKQKSLRARLASFGSWVAPVDWEGDGDLDLLIGTFSGQLFRRVNDGTRAAPEYTTESIEVEVDGAPLKVRCHTNPVAADWNGDGLWDLVVSAGDGSVGWYENVGSKTAPEFGPRQVLIEAKSKNKFWTQYVAPGAEPKPGVRAQICVTDYNGDGRLDLIVGDYSKVVRLRDLSVGEQKKFAELRLAEDQAMAQVYTADEAKKKELRAELKKIGEAKKAFVAQDAGDDRMSSFVWVFLRMTPASAR